MREKVIRSIIFFGSFILLASSVWVITWIQQNEELRLAVLEQFEWEQENQLQVQALADASANETILAETDRAFADIDTLLSSIGMDDWPDEE